jgi:hypothetical protein
MLRRRTPRFTRRGPPPLPTASISRMRSDTRFAADLVSTESREENNPIFGRSGARNAHAQTTSRDPKPEVASA